MLKGNCVVGQSGGPTSVINASLAGVIKAASESELIDSVYGAVHGIEGVLLGNLINLSERFDTDEKLDLLKHTPAAYLGSCRHKIAKDNDEEYEKVFKTFKENNVKYFFYIGGNDSMDTVDRLSKYAKKIDFPMIIVGIPKTIDNDLAITDHSPGFGSAAKYIATTMREIILDSQVYDKFTVTIVEVMGRNAGWLTCAAALARTEGNPAPHFIYLPEYTFSIEEFIKDIKEAGEKYKNVIVAVSEGVKTADGKYVCESAMLNAADSFGHKQLTGTAATLARFVAAETKAKVRAIELSLMQRCGAHIASLTDVTEAESIGIAGVKAALEGQNGVMVYYDRISNNPYKIEIKTKPVSEVANVERLVPKEWIDSKGQNVSPDLINYILPLINGESAPKFENGLPIYAKR